MKVKDIQIEGFGVWSGLSVDSIPDGMTVFYGPNEAGKTTLMQFLRAMFYGFTPDRRNRYLPPVYGGRPGGAIRVTGPGGGYEISRRAQLNDQGVMGQLTVTSGDGLVQGQHRLAMLLGQVDESIFTNVFAIGLRELQELSTLDDTAAADELYKLSSGLDRVSLVDVIRQLKGARGQIVGPTPDHGQMQGLIARREKLKDEQEQLIAKGKRWGELAAQKRSHQTEIDDLRQRKEHWETESKLLETALQVREPWNSRDRLKLELAGLNARVDLPDDSGQKLRDYQQQIDERRTKLQGVIEQRKAVRDRARALPLQRNILELSSKIDAANEQVPWITALQKQIYRLESEVAASREQLTEDAKRLGVSEEDQLALLNDKRMANLPDLSRQAITQLAGPSREVRIQTTKLKQAKHHHENDRKEADRLKAEIDAFLGDRDQEDLHAAMQSHIDLIGRLRAQQQIEDKLDKLVKHRKELQEDAAELEAEDALPLERFFVLMIPFAFGAVMLMVGFAKLIGDNRLFFERDQQRGWIFSLIGLVVLLFWYTWKNVTEKGTGDELNDCEDQLGAVIRQIKKTEQERDEIARSLPAYTGTSEQQLREYERELQLYEEMLPVHHNYQAAIQRIASAKKRGSIASQNLKQAKQHWKKSLQQLGLAESLSPKSIRIMAEGYETLMQSRKRLKTLEDELNQRKIELSSITQRVEALVRQAAAVRRDADGKGRPSGSREDRKGEGREERSREERRTEASARDLAKRTDPSLQLVRSGSETTEGMPTDGAVSKLQELTAMLASQQSYIQQKKQLKEEDEQLAKQQKAIRKGIDKIVLARQSLLAELGVENQSQLDEHLDVKKEHFRLLKQINEFDDRIRAIIGGNAPYEAVVKLLDGPSAHELEKRWDALLQKIQQSEQRSLQLHQRQGEVSQEMKSLAADRRLSEVKLELAVIEQQLQACASHWQTLAASTMMLEKVCEVYENERQPETLREASAFLKQLTDEKYVRVWTPLGKNALRIDNHQGQSLPLEVLSRGTREAVFIALRLSLAAAYARRGVTLPLVLDDVLVNFDTVRAKQAARVLRDFAELGNQVVMFTCHEHIMRMFYEIGVQVRVLPTQGKPGEALVYTPEERYIEPPRVEPVPEIVEVKVEAPAPIIVPPAPLVEPEPIVIPEPVVVQSQPVEPQVELVRIEIPKKPKSQPVPKPAPVMEVEEIPAIDHLWYELDPAAAMWADLDQLPPPEEGEATSEEDTTRDPWWSNV